MAQGQGAHHHRRSRVMMFTRPEADWNAVTTRSPPTPANLPRGATMGMDSVARPDEDGIRMVRGRYRANTSSVKLMAPAPEKGLLSPVEDRVG